MVNLEARNKMLESERARLLRKINSLEEQLKLNYLSHVETTGQFVEGRQQLYDRLEQILEYDNFPNRN